MSGGTLGGEVARAQAREAREARQAGLEAPSYHLVSCEPLCVGWKDTSLLKSAPCILKKHNISRRRKVNYYSNTYS